MKDEQKKKDAVSLKIKCLAAACIVLAIAVIALSIVVWNITSEDQATVQLKSEEHSTQPTEKAEVQPSDKQETQPTSQTNEERPEIVLFSTQEQDDAVIVQTSYGDLRYPYAYSDLIRVSANNTDGVRALEFYARLPSGTYSIYTICFYSAEGISIGTLQLPSDAQPEPVGVVFHEAPASLGEDDLRSFYAAQDTFTDVWLSFAENEAFVPTEGN